MRKLLALFAVLATAVAIAALPASAITNGTPDGQGHPYVGLVTFYDEDGVYLWRCSATLMSSTLLLTAGHCTESPAVAAQVWFDTGPIEAGTYPLAPIEDRPPCTGYTGWPCEGGDATGTPHTHPAYDPNAFYLHDLGVVTLKASVTGKGSGELPSLGEVGRLPKHAELTAVGYGLQKSFPDPASWKDEAVRIRMVAHMRLMGINNNFVGDFAFETSFGANGGGTCFGDSGGPIFIGNSNVLAGVNSFGWTDTCKGHNGGYRVDQLDDLEWLEEEFGLTP